MLDPKFQLLNKIIKIFKGHGLYATIDQDTICIGRQQWDKYSKQYLDALSAAPYVKQGKKSFYIFAVEQYDSSRKITKYSIKLSNQFKQPIKLYHYNLKRGSHIHKVVDGKEDKKHIKFSKKIDDIVGDMLGQMRLY